MNRAAILWLIFCCLTKTCLASHPSGVASRNVSNNKSTEERYYNLLGALQAAISQHRGTSKTSNVGVALRDRQDLANYHGNPARHCADIYKAGYHENGVYTISPPGAPNLDVYCDMSPRMNKSGGWTVFQKRLDGKVDFYRDWLEYRRGFGDVKAEHWLGLENIYLLTHSEPMQLFIYLEDRDGNWRWAHYDVFAVSSEFNKYRLDIGSYLGTAGDSLSYHSGEHFSTKDQDNDPHSTHCATVYKGAWWYKGCYESSLNGQYLKGARNDHFGIQWRKWRDKYSLKTAIMMMKPVYDN